ncbi:11829_t:CDS:2 [Cetraspora pellucida]|uniref:11829_t:CDS:1 n=1 Tax=Cetraspora pellucida TaxID=1433469 RepID=A0ACA9L584_9GLOM|nr:11829_t:CDS:2 [Cetraspora pellucida]
MFKKIKEEYKKDTYLRRILKALKDPKCDEARRLGKQIEIDRIEVKKAEHKDPDLRQDVLNTGIEVEKDDPKGLEWYSEKAEESNADELLILNDPKEPANAKKEDDSKALGWYSKKEDLARLNNK